MVNKSKNDSMIVDIAFSYLYTGRFLFPFVFVICRYK